MVLSASRRAAAILRAAFVNRRQNFGQTAAVRSALAWLSFSTQSQTRQGVLRQFDAGCLPRSGESLNVLEEGGLAWRIGRCRNSPMNSVSEDRGVRAQRRRVEARAGRRKIPAQASAAGGFLEMPG